MTMTLGWRWLLCCVVAMTVVRCEGEDVRVDTVWLEPLKTSANADSWFPGSITQHKGIIKSLDHLALRMIVDESPTETTFAAHRVLWIEFGKVSEKESSLTTLFREQKRPESLLLLRDVLREPLPRWRKKWRMIQAANSMWNVTGDSSAFQMMSAIGSEPLPPLILASLPVAWTRSNSERTELNVGQFEANVKTPEQRLVFLSWRLRALGRDRAIAAIEMLTNDKTRPYVGKLADTLRWRLANPNEVRENAKLWEAKIDALPMVLQVGPTLMLIEKLEAAGLAEDAKRLRLSLQLTPPFPHPSLGRD